MATFLPLRCLVAVALLTGFVAAFPPHISVKEVDRMITLLKRLENGATSAEDGSDISNSTSYDDSMTTTDEDAQAEFEIAQMVVIKGKTGRHVPEFIKPWLNLSPEQAEGGTDEVLSHDEKVRLNLEGETSEDETEYSYGTGGNRQKRKFIYPKGDINLWPMGIVPYRFATNQRAFQNANSYDMVRTVMRWYETYTCIRWVEATPAVQQEVGHNSFVEIGGGARGVCQSYVGRGAFAAPKRELTLSEFGCIRFSTIAHEMAHALGLHHEHVRSDRDQYVSIIYDRLQEAGRHNWEKAKTINYAPYDLGSVMHYNLFAGAKPSERGKKVIVSKDPELDFLATTRKPQLLSFYDLFSVNHGYGCADTCDPMPACKNGGYPNKECGCACPDHLTGDLCEDIKTDQDCGGVIELRMNQKVEISSPNYPAEYNLYADCGWLIRGPELSQITLTFDKAFDIPTGRVVNRFNGQSEEICVHHVEVRYNLIGQPGPRYCGQKWQRGDIAATVDGQANLMLIRFNSSQDEDAGTGFRATITARSIGCQSSPCLNGGSCRERKTGIFCACPKGFTGRFCQLIGTAPISCDMDDARECPFDNDKNAELPWEFRSEATLSPGTGPSSGLGGSGRYIYVEASRVPQGHSARFMSDLFKPSARCLGFYYHMLGSRQGSLKVKLLEEGQERVVFSLIGNQGEEWKYHRMTLRSKKQFRIIFEGAIGSGFMSDIALDNITVTIWKCRGEPETEVSPPLCGSRPCGNGGTCIRESTTNALKCVCPKGFSGQQCELMATGTQFCFFDGRGMRCPFEAQPTTNGWTINTGPTPTQGTGPEKGHGKKGAYLYIDAQKMTEGQSASFTSKLFDASPRCLKFNYHMFGATMGSLTVTVVPQGESEKVVFSKSGNQGNRWRRQKITVSADKPYKLVITATRGPGVQSDIAIDSIKITYWRCGQKPPKPSKASDVKPQIVEEQVTCTFDDGTLCNFAQSETGSLKWTPQQGPSGTQEFGPLGDHTGKGYYLALQATKSEEFNNDVSIASDVMPFPESQDICLSFWYHIDDVTTGSLSAAVLWKDNGQTRRNQLWTSGRPISTGQWRWRHEQFTVNQPSPVQIEFTGMVKAANVIVALDDVTVKPGRCPSRPADRF